MYSRYTPNEKGGFDRKLVRTERDSPPSEQRPLFPNVGPEPAAQPPMSDVKIPVHTAPSRREHPHPPPQRPLFTLGNLLPGDMNVEDLLIMAVLVLILMEEGASGTVVMSALLLYLVLGKLEE